MKRYEKYKDSGVEWIGEIPEGWEVKKSRYLFQIRKRIAGKFGYDILSITQKGIKIKDIKSNDGQIASDYSKYQIVEKNDFAMNHMDLLTWFIDIASQEGVTSPDYRVFSSIDNQSDRKYYLFLFQMMYTRKIFYVFGRGAALFGRWRLPADEFKSFLFPCPSKSEQTAIANYLDQKTAEIDELIAQKERLLELYEEEKTAIINQAVTKGIDPDVKLKDSGIDWLGDIPEGWEVCKLKHLVEVKDGTHDTPDYVVENEDAFPLVTSKDVVTGEIDFSNCKHISRGSFEAINIRSNVAKNDILMPMIGTVGGAVIVETDKEFSIKNVALFKTNDSFLSPNYLQFLLNSEIIKIQFQFESRGGVQNFVSLSLLKNIQVLKISKNDQTAIVNHIETETTRINAKIVKTKRIIELQKEYRTALISEVVTGKIKVTQEAVS